MNRPHASGWTFAALVVVAGGCTTNWHRAETVLKPDGSVERNIYQPSDQTPAEAVRRGLWKFTRAAPQLDDGEWPGAIRDVPAVTDDKSPYFLALGRFASADEIPKHFVRANADGSRAGTLTRIATRNDFGFVVEHVWRETLTDIVTLDDLAEARRDVSHLALAILEAVLADVLGKEYDAKPLLDWLRGDGVRWFEELTNAYVEVSLRRPPDRDAELLARVREISARHGLERLEKADVRAFAAAKVKEHVRGADGKPLPDETVTELLVCVGLADAPPAKEEGAEPPGNRFETAARRLIEKRYGSQEAFEKRALSLVSRIIGVYGFFAKQERFEYEMTMPGIVVDTTGTLLGDAKVRWSFTAADAYPFGHVMQVRSIERTDLAARLLSKEALRDRGDLAAFADLAASDAEIQAALGECAMAGNLTAVDRYCAPRREPDDRNRFNRVRRLERLLKLR